MGHYINPRELAESVIGTCNNIVDELEELTLEESYTFDSLVFCCDGCGWWCGTEELNNLTDEELCDQCNDEREED
jgi:hypothetical protein